MVTKLLTSQECDDIITNLDLSQSISEDSNYYGGTQGWLQPDIAKKYLPKAEALIIKTHDIKSLTNIYVRTYLTNTQLKMHTDQPGYDVTMTVCVENSDPDFTLCVSNLTHPDPWPFNSEGDLTPYYHNSLCYDLRPGECVSMQGRRYPHWRPTKYSLTPSTYIFYSWECHDH